MCKKEWTNFAAYKKTKIKQSPSNQFLADRTATQYLTRRIFTSKFQLVLG